MNYPIFRELQKLVSARLYFLRNNLIYKDILKRKNQLKKFLGIFRCKITIAITKQHLTPGAKEAPAAGKASTTTMKE